MTDFKDLIEGHDAMVAATNGDLAPIAMRLKSGSITERERVWLACRLLGEHKLAPGRKRGSQSKNGRNPIKDKKNFEDNNDIDLAVWDAYFHLCKFEGKLQKEAKDEIACILGETEKNIRNRLTRVRKHLGSGKKRTDYITSSRGDHARLKEALKSVGIGMDSVEIRIDPFPQFGGNLPFLLALARN